MTGPKYFLISQIVVGSRTANASEKLDLDGGSNRKHRKTKLIQEVKFYSGSSYIRMYQVYA